MLRSIMLLRTHRGLGRPPYENVALVLQGGGALGAELLRAFKGFVEKPMSMLV